MEIVYSNDYLAHHGILGQKWGVRRYQNPDGSLTEAGQRRYDKSQARLVKKEAKLAKKEEKRERKRLKKEEKELEKKNKIIISANPKKIISYQDKLTLQELNMACERARLTTALRGYSKQNKANSLQKIGTVLNTGVGIMNSIYQGTELVSKLDNAFTGKNKQPSLASMDMKNTYDWVRKNVKNGKQAEDVSKYLVALDKAMKFNTPEG